LQIIGGDPDQVDDKKRSIPFSKVECLMFSFKSLAKITNLKGLECLNKLQLDNNHITKVENIAHLVSKRAHGDDACTDTGHTRSSEGQ
jgi:hypothetical protein